MLPSSRPAVAFAACVPLRVARALRPSCSTHRPIVAKAKKGKRAKKPRQSKPSRGASSSDVASSDVASSDVASSDVASSDVASSDVASSDASSDTVSSDASPFDTLASEVMPPMRAPTVPDVLSDEAFQNSDDLPVSDEPRLRLPDIETPTIRRRRKPRRADPSVGRSVDQDAPLSSGSIRRLTAAYRRGGEDAQELIGEIEKNPDYMFQTGNPSGEYDLTSAIIGSGRPNKEGLYLLPYLQSGHFLLLIIIVVAAFVYYPGFPLTEAEDSVREMLKKGLVLVGVGNAVLAAFAFEAAKKRGQPPLFWAFKTAFLGDLAYGELRRNAPLLKNSEKTEKKK